MKKYVITLLGARKNEKEDIMPRLFYDGNNENIEHKTLGVLSNANNALEQMNKLAKYLEEDLHEKVTIKTQREGDKVRAEIYSFCSDESQNKYVTQVFLTTIIEDEDIYVDELFYQL